MKQLLRRYGQAAAAVLLLFAVLAVSIVALLPVAEIFTEADQEQRRHARMTAAFLAEAATVPQLESRLADAKQRDVDVSAFLTGDTPAAAAGALSRLLRSGLETRGGTVRSMTVLPASTEGEVQRVTVRVEATLDEAALPEFLYDLETTTSPSLFIDTIDLRGGISAPNAGQRRTTLSLRADVTAYRKATTP